MKRPLSAALFVPNAVGVISHKKGYVIMSLLCKNQYQEHFLSG